MMGAPIKIFDTKKNVKLAVFEEVSEEGHIYLNMKLEKRYIDRVTKSYEKWPVYCNVRELNRIRKVVEAFFVWYPKWLEKKKLIATQKVR